MKKILAACTLLVAALLAIALFYPIPDHVGNAAYRGDSGCQAIRAE
jgi:hypothetical protein